MTQLLTELLPQGKLREALACSAAMERNVVAQRDSLGSSLVADVTANHKLLLQILAPRRPGTGRLFHNPMQLSPDFPHSSSALGSGSDKSIHVQEGLLTGEQCADLIALWERSKSFDGNMMRSDGTIVVNHTNKKAREFDVSSTAHEDAEWAAAEVLLMSMLYKALGAYAADNPIIYTWVAPLHDDGFRMKRYVPDGTEHHAYHADAMPTNRRLIAFLLYLSDVEEGGETVFLNHNLAVKPKCGRALMFPAAFSYVHAGKRPVSGTKYVVANFVSSGS
jgi:hypothetical protein